MALWWQWQWDGCSFSQVTALSWGLTRFLFPLVLLCWINSCGWSQKLLAGKHYKTLPKNEPVSLMEGWGPLLRFPLIPRFCELFHLVPWPNSVSQQENGNGKNVLIREAEPSLEFYTRTVNAHSGNKPSGTLKSESWHWKSPMSTESLWGNRVVMRKFNKEKEPLGPKQVSRGCLREVLKDWALNVLGEAQMSALVPSLEIPMGRDWWTCSGGRPWPCYSSYQKSPGCPWASWGQLGTRDRHMEEATTENAFQEGPLLHLIMWLYQELPLSWGFQGLTL